MEGGWRCVWEGICRLVEGCGFVVGDFRVSYHHVAPSRHGVAHLYTHYLEIEIDRYNP